jgi:pimeloyl-ACP methyl ester carboxylesterase
MRRIVEALFHDPSYPADDAYVQRRYESSIAPGAWEALAAARFRRPGLEPPPLPSSARPYERIAVPTLVVEGECDKLLPSGWAAEIAGQISGGRSCVVPKAGHCPQIEQPSVVDHVVVDFLSEVQRKVPAHGQRTDGQGRDRHRRRVRARRRAGTSVRRRRRESAYRRYRP